MYGTQGVGRLFGGVESRQDNARIYLLKYGTPAASRYGIECRTSRRLCASQLSD
jgi:hypothetical protein